MPRVTSLVIRDLDASPDENGRLEVEVCLTLRLPPNRAADVILLLDGTFGALWQLLDNPPTPPPERDRG